ncbi:MAG: hypothetical protein Q8Q49_04675 [bacterium]|nr:hypothetical protein [bacterium]
MDKKLFDHFQKGDQLSIKNPDYQHILEELFLFLVRNDHVKEDSTVKAFLPGSVAERLKNGVIAAKTACVVSGLEEVTYLCNTFTKLTPHAFVRDGEIVSPGTKVLSLDGSAKEILSHERALLNILQRMSGIATETGKYVAKVQHLKLPNPPMIAATRKTPWMHIDKKAVAVGGGATHRLDLKDGILLKDNHLELLRQEYSLKNEAEAISYAIGHSDIVDKKIAIEVEVKTDDAAFVAVTSWKKKKLQNPFIIMLDNFTPERAKKVIAQLRHPEFISGSRKMLNQVQHDKENVDIFFEASGGITLDNVADFAKTGVDIISIGVLTHSPKAADLSLDIV